MGSCVSVSPTIQRAEIRQAFSNAVPKGPRAVAPCFFPSGQQQANAFATTQHTARLSTGRDECRRARTSCPSIRGRTARHDRSPRPKGSWSKARRPAAPCPDVLKSEPGAAPSPTHSATKLNLCGPNACSAPRNPGPGGIRRATAHTHPRRLRFSVGILMSAWVNAIGSMSLAKWDLRGSEVASRHVKRALPVR